MLRHLAAQASVLLLGRVYACARRLGSMADACNARQRNLYERASTRHIKEYMDGKGDTYEEQIRKMSWPICTDVRVSFHARSFETGW